MAKNDFADRYPPHFLDALTEIINIGVGRAAGVLNQMISSKIILKVPHLEIIRAEDVGVRVGELSKAPLSTVKIEIAGDIAGTASLLFIPDSASKLVSLLTGEAMSSPDLDSLKTETLNEVGNILLNSVLGSIANMFEMRLHYSIPHYREGAIGEIFSSADNHGDVIMAHTTFLVKEHLIEGKILLLFTLGSIGNLLAAIEKSMK